MTSSIGFTVDIHFCGNEFQSFALLGKAKKCATEDVKATVVSSVQSNHACCKNKSEKQEKASQPCHKSKDGVKSDDCCHNKTLHVESEVVDQPVFMQSILVKLMVAEVVYSFNFKPIIQENLPARYFQYKSPPIVTDANIQYQVFRI